MHGFVIGAPWSDQCSQAMEKLDEVCQQLSVSPAKRKKEGPTTNISLGIEVDNYHPGRVRLPRRENETSVITLGVLERYVMRSA